MAMTLKSRSWFFQQRDGEDWAPFCNLWSQTNLLWRKNFDLMRNVGCLGKERSEKKRLFLRCCSNGSCGNGWNSMAENENFVKMMREAEPYFRAHRGSTFVLVLSAEIVDSPFLGSILE
ncbi:unnamed protein product, partial [Ilex paraguariensis]